MSLLSFLIKSLLNAPFKSLKKTKLKEIDFLISIYKKEKYLEGFMFNHMGYAYLGNKQVNAAYVIFKSNTEIFLDSPNVYDSYAEVLALKGNKKEALKHYKQSVLLIEKQK